MHVFGSFGWLWKVAIFIAVGTSLYAVHLALESRWVAQTVALGFFA